MAARGRAVLQLALVSAAAAAPRRGGAGTCSRGPGGGEGGCARPLSEAPVLVQRRARAVLRVDGEAGWADGREDQDDGRFLLHATFGPTRGSLAELGGKTYQEWIQEQMLLPAGSHREYFRQRANPRFDPEVDYVLKERSACSKGSRWHRYALSFADVGKRISVSSGRILVDGILRSEIDAEFSKNGLDAPSQCTDVPTAQWQKKGLTCAQKASQMKKYCKYDGDWIAGTLCQQSCYDAGLRYIGDDCSAGWSALDGLSGFVCFVEEAVGGLVALSTRSNCAETSRSFMENPAIWFSDISHAKWTGLSFEASATKAGLTFLSEDSPNCNLGGHEFIRGPHLRTGSSVAFYRYDARIELADNTCKLQGEEGAPDGDFGLCGSPGEVQNVPTEGHQLPLRAAHTDDEKEDTLYDNRYGTDRASRPALSNSLGKGAVWLARVLGGRDQLRQRMAWALSQIFVIGSSGTSHDQWNELFVAYYDIFVRNAFGSFRSLLQEVTFSPLMGEYLTFVGSRSYDTSGSYPDENYAREIMQLFTIGLAKLTPDGRVQVDGHGVDVPTYDNDNIMSFARVFTGFVRPPWRNNIELRDGRNYIDPMRLRAGHHDFFPKQDLYGGYLGDGLPLCSALPERPFLLHGARFEWRGTSLPDCTSYDTRYEPQNMPGQGATKLESAAACQQRCASVAGCAHFAFYSSGNCHLQDSAARPAYRQSVTSGPPDCEALAFEPEPGSELLRALCGGDASDCRAAPSRTLTSALACRGAECSLDGASIFKVGGGYYEFVPPACVHPFFFEGRYIADGQSFDKLECAQPYGRVASASCCNAGCRNNPTSGMASAGRGCRNHSETWVSRKGVPVMTASKCRSGGSSWNANKFCQLACWEAGVGYPGDDCSAGEYVERVACGEPSDLGGAEAYCEGQGLSLCPAKTDEVCEPKGGRVWTPEACAIPVQVHADGAVSAHTDDHQQNRFRVSWIGPDRAPAGEYSATVETTAVFGTTPSSDDVLAILKVAVLAPPPGAACAQPCSGDVRVWGPSPPDVDTVFEVGGRFYKNEQSVVRVGPASFRNPPVFVAPGPLRQSGRALERAVRAEIDTLLDHLFHHPNTPVFVSKKLIQRFVTSNPSPSYVESVVRAFTTGSHDGVAYSGKYGDLGATIGAILLHPEARSSNSSAAGLLREPMLKLVHFMRSMEYVDMADQEVVFQNLDEVIGQFPYRSPTVFNFYDAMYQPPSFADMAAAPEPEPEPEPAAASQPGSDPEPEPEPEPEPLVAPEFQIFTPPLAMGFLNGVASLLDHGVSKCDDGLGNAGSGKECHQGSFNFTAAAPDAEGVVRELDILLTGGRLAPATKELVRAAYQERGLKGAQQAVVLTPEFQTLGVPQHSGERPTEEAPPPPSSSGSYKAVVMLFLHGGADTYNLIVPIGCSLYEEYATARTSMAIAQGSLLPVTASSEQPCGQFGIHPSLPFLRELYEEKKQAAFVSSVGALVEPVTRDTFKGGGAKTCLGLFSHSHLQSAAHTLKCQVPGAAPRGAGGRMADALAASHGKAVASFSISGMSTWSGGYNTSTDIIDKTGGAIRFNKYSVWSSTVSGIAKQKYGSVYCEEYTRAFADHVRSSEALGAILDDVTLETAATYETVTGLAKQLHQVARLIKGRGLRLAERDLFFVQLGGFDTHFGQADRLSENFAEIDGALRDFVGELTQQGVFDDVVIVTHSDFGRTLTSNGAGTDHGWGGNHVVIGGGIHGGQIFNRFLQTYAPGSPYDAGRGRVIPQHPWESVMVPIAEWMGVEELEAVFPNLPNFNRSTHIIGRGSLFKS